METIYLTPASISFLNQFLLAVLMMAYLAVQMFVLKKQQVSISGNLLIAFLASVSVFSALLFFEVSVLPSKQLPIVYVENIVVGLSLFFLLQFAYYFPTPVENQKYERWFALIFFLAYTFWEAGFAVWRLWLLESGEAVYRPQIMDFPPLIGFVWVVVSFLRGNSRRDRSTGKGFALAFVIPICLTVINVLLAYFNLSTLFYHISLSVGILFTLLFFVQAYLSSQQNTVPFSVSLAGIILTSSLALFGIIAWLVTPVYAEEFRPEIIDHRTLSFLPNDKGGYTVTEIPFSFETNFGESLSFQGDEPKPTERISFDFPFFNQPYQDIYISKYGTLGIGEDIDFREYEIEFTRTPAIMPLLVAIDFDGNPGGIYWRKDADRLIVTYDRVHSYVQADKIYTFQVILYSSGDFSITYNGLPENYMYYPNDRPDATVWAIGVKPSQAPSAQSNFTNLPIEGGPEGLIQDNHLAFRKYLDRLVLPIAITVFVIGFVLLLGIPLILNYNLARPLATLVAGVEKMNNGQLDIMLPVKFNDEIGYLTKSFNTLGMELKSLVNELETRVSNRTSDLVAANEQLLKLSVAVEQSPSTIVITDTHANIEYVNPAFTHSTGYTFEEVKGKNPRILKSDLTPAATYKEMWEQLSAGNSWRGELVNKKKDGSVFWEYSVITPIRDANGRLTHYAAIKEDVTARVMAEDALRESEEQYRLLFDLESDAIFIIRNSDGQILEANKAATDLYGYTRGELFSLKNTDLSAEPASTQKATNTSIPSDQVITIPLRYHRKKDGAVFPVDITARFVTWEGQSVHIAAIRDITQRKQIEEELVKLSITDPLTEIANRRYFYIQAEQLFNHKQIPNTLAAIMMDVDHFKQVNDNYGHAAGDAILRQLARRLYESLRPTDILARYGGEEFAILLPRTSLYEAEHVAKRLWGAINEKPFSFENHLVPVTISIGVSVLSADMENLDMLMRHADEALYQAKQAGRNQWVIWGNKTDGGT